MLERAATTVADRPLAALLSDDPVRQQQVIAPSPPRGVDAMQPAPTFLVGPRFDSEWHADMDVTRIALSATQTSGGRAALLGKTVAYWVGTLVARRPVAPPTVLRGTFVLEKRCPAAACRWLVVQGHVSRAIDDDELARRVFGSIVASTSPLRFACDELHSAAP